MSDTTNARTDQQPAKVNVTNGVSLDRTSYMLLGVIAGLLVVISFTLSELRDAYVEFEQHQSAHLHDEHHYHTERGGYDDGRY